jgi:hypothetical protein
MPSPFSRNPCHGISPRTIRPLMFGRMVGILRASAGKNDAVEYWVMLRGCKSQNCYPRDFLSTVVT